MVFVTSDHGGYMLKQRLVPWLLKQGWLVVDLGPAKKRAQDDYPFWGARLGRRVAKDPNSFGIAVCRSGVGMVVAANKIPGVRAAQAWSVAMARSSRLDDHSNVLSLAADYQSWPAIQRIVRAWLTTAYRPTIRFERRLRELARLDHGR